MFTPPPLYLSASMCVNYLPDKALTIQLRVTTESSNVRGMIVKSLLTYSHKYLHLTR